MTTHLTDDEARLQDYLDGRLPLPETRAVADHLAGCADCRAALGQWEQLDSALARRITGPALSPGFKARLLGQTERRPAPASPAGGAIAPEQLDAQFRAIWRAQRQKFFRSKLPVLLDSVGYGTAAAIGALLLLRLVTASQTGLLKALALSAEQLTMLIASAAGALCLLAGIALAAKSRLIRWLAD
jgi:anti-sigma factor RsiW